ncbi:MAG: carboxypeptidase-like regulatory domain-containing protein [Chloroflexi bacterium]|nr:carboxypeptidase-like regulatory domain-containing protein [Chloroflexota bacterium]
MPSARAPHLVLLVVLLAVLAAGCDGSSAPSADASAPADDGVCGAEEVADGGIDGSIVNTDGEPLEDILVIIEHGDGFRGTARTGEDGRFTGTGVSGVFTITTVDAGHTPVVRTVTVPCGVLVPVELILAPVGE